MELRQKKKEPEKSKSGNKVRCHTDGWLRITGKKKQAHPLRWKGRTKEI